MIRKKEMMPMNIKERPGARRYILARGFRPYIDREGYWDGVTAIGSDGQVVGLCAVWAKQMRRMVAEGHFGKIAKRIWVWRSTGRVHARIVHN